MLVSKNKTASELDGGGCMGLIWRAHNLMLSILRCYGDESPVYVYEAHLRGLRQVRGINTCWTA